MRRDPSAADRRDRLGGVDHPAAAERDQTAVADGVDERGRDLGDAARARPWWTRGGRLGELRRRAAQGALGAQQLEVAEPAARRAARGASLTRPARGAMKRSPSRQWKSSP